MEYYEVIEQQKKKLHTAIQWWPEYFYHFTDVRNALGIIDKEWIYDRNTAVEQHLMESDNASSSVIEATLSSTKHYGRLYFRPLTPTQYHNEGYKPAHVRRYEINANCPMPIFFCLDAERTLQMPGVCFVERGMAGGMHGSLCSGVEAYRQLNFAKIYHNGPHEAGSDITQYRHSEIVRENGIPIEGVLRKICCRTLAEKQTLLYLLQRQLPYKYKKYYGMIEYNPRLNMFYNNGIFIKRIKQTNKGLFVELNDAALRAGRDKAIGNDLKMEIELYWTNMQNREVIQKETPFCWLNYARHTGLNIPVEKKYSNLVLVAITFDGVLMYEDYVNLTMLETV